MHQGVVANYIFNKLKALLILGGALLLVCCGSSNDVASGSNESNEYLVTESSSNLVIHMSENGRTSYIFEAPLVKGYTLASEPYRIFPDGVKITTFTTDDSLNTSTVNGVLTANYATYYEDRQLWEAIGDVLVVKSDGRELSSQQLFWDAVTKRIYSNVDTRIEDHSTGDLYNGEGFESNEEMTEWSFRKLKGRMRVEESVNRGGDSSGSSSGVDTKEGNGVSDTLAVSHNSVGGSLDVEDMEGEAAIDTVVPNRGRSYVASELEETEFEAQLDTLVTDLILTKEASKDVDSVEVVDPELILPDTTAVEEDENIIVSEDTPALLEESLETPNDLNE